METASSVVENETQPVNDSLVNIVMIYLVKPQYEIMKCENTNYVIEYE